MKETIRKYALELGVDDVGFASADGYASPKSPPLSRALDGAKTLVVLAYRELSSCESESPQIAMNGRLDLMEFSRSVNYKLARFIERETGEKAVTVPVSYPLQMTMETLGSVGEVSLRHAAAAAGLGRFGRNNLVLHPEFGSRVLFTAVATTAEFSADPPLAEDPCIQCGKLRGGLPGPRPRRGGEDRRRQVPPQQPAAGHRWEYPLLGAVERSRRCGAQGDAARPEVLAALPGGVHRLPVLLLELHEGLPGGEVSWGTDNGHRVCCWAPKSQPPWVGFSVAEQGVKRLR